MTQKILILGATGSIGSSTLEIIRQHPDKYEIHGIVANHNAKGLASIANEYGVLAVGIRDEGKVSELKENLKNKDVKIYVGENEICELASMPHDTTVSAIVGVAGLKPTMAALKGCKKLAIANKESIICAGSLILKEAKNRNVKVIPVDSEHNAIFQVLESDKLDMLSHVAITASGGPFKNFSVADMANITPEQAVKHPNWSMGAKNSIDSATLMNKGLEFIEACTLFDLDSSRVEVLIHPQSIIHGMAHYKDGSTLAQLSLPDMKVPISYALAYPKRIAIEHKKLDLARVGTLNFDAPDYIKFPLLKMAMDSYSAQDQSTLIRLNTANEVAVNSFLKNEIPFLGIAKVVAKTLERMNSSVLASLDEIAAYNEEVVEFAKKSII